MKDLLVAGGLLGRGLSGSGVLESLGDLLVFDVESVVLGGAAGEGTLRLHVHGERPVVILRDRILVREQVGDHLSGVLVGGQFRHDSDLGPILDSRLRDDRVIAIGGGRHVEREAVRVTGLREQLLGLVGIVGEALCGRLGVAGEAIHGHRSPSARSP